MKTLARICKVYKEKYPLVQIVLHTATADTVYESKWNNKKSGRDDNCWLASNVVVCGGVTIGEGCVIGAGSVVTRDIPPYSLAAGNPCRVIRKITEKDHME